VDFSGSKLRAARGGVRVRLSNHAVKDLREWAKIGECGRVFVEQEAGMAVHTDAAELGWGAV
jgi:hypothetical protein